MGEIFAKIIGTILIPILIVLIGLGVYAFVAFLGWLFSDPLNIIDDNFAPDSRTPAEIKWDKCVNQATYMFDQFNDTVLTTYGTDDRPATEVQNFMKLCTGGLQENKEV